MTTRLEKFFTQLDLDGIKMVHFGIKGMHWGIRRSDAELAKSSSDAIRAKETLNSINKAGSISAASDSDLNHLVNRLNLEKRYSEAVSSPSVPAKGHSAIKSLLGAGDTMNKAISFANSPAGKLLSAALGQKSIGKHARR